MVRVHLTISLFSECIKEAFSCELLKKIIITGGRGKIIYGRQVKGRGGIKKEKAEGEGDKKGHYHRKEKRFLSFCFSFSGLQES